MVRVSQDTFPIVHLGRMDTKRKSYLLLLLGFIGALFFLVVKMALYDKLEYELDLFSILQLSRDYVLDKPFLYENSYGDNKAVHNYYLMPLFAPLTLIFGGKGLFVGGFLLMLWALYLAVALLKELPWGKAVLFLMLFFSPTAFFLWDNFRFGWHAETFFYPLSIIFISALMLNRKFPAWASATFIILNREDGILIVLALYIMYEAAKSQEKIWAFFKRMVPAMVLGGIIFMGGIVLLHLFSGEESRINATMKRFLENYTHERLMIYFWDSAKNWFFLCGLVWILALYFMKKQTFLFWSMVCLAPIIAVNAYAGAYYFADPRYGINWAPRLAGTYGFLMSILLVSMYYGKNDGKTKSPFILPCVGLIVFLLQMLTLRNVPYQNFEYRLNLAFFLPAQKEDERVIDELKKLSSRIPTSYPVRLDWNIFALFDHTDFMWNNAESKPFREPRLLIVSGNNANSKPIPAGFEKISQIGKFGVWANPNDEETKSFVQN